MSCITGRMFGAWKMNVKLETTQNPIKPDDDVITRLSRRVRSARKAQGMPRRVLSEKSGVSPRYLAQLEAGEGNISVMLLQRVAAALEVKIEDLLCGEAALSRDAQHVGQLYQTANPDTQQDVLKLLAARSSANMRAQRVCLIGVRGAGKSTLGRKAAAALNIPFVELAAEVEARAGVPVATIMAEQGEDAYRAFEREAVDDIIRKNERLILAASGGVVSQMQTYERLKSYFHTIWISTSPAEHIARIREQGDLRPMEGHAQMMEHLKTMLSMRAPLYAQTLAQVNTSNRPEQSSVNDVLTTISKNRFIEKRGP